MSTGAMCGTEHGAHARRIGTMSTGAAAKKAALLSCSTIPKSVLDHTLTQYCCPYQATTKSAQFYYGPQPGAAFSPPPTGSAGSTIRYLSPAHRVAPYASSLPHVA
eukprot:1659352-Rhodomonas_salina.2